MNLTLTDEEREYLHRILSEELGRLKEEIHHTQASDYKDELRADERRLLALIGRLESDTAG
ncbi:MAG TPA: hypothetical protein VF071_11235 [Candidatus Limnocylindria bacterium]